MNEHESFGAGPGPSVDPFEKQHIFKTVNACAANDISNTYMPCMEAIIKRHAETSLITAIDTRELYRIIELLVDDASGIEIENRLGAASEAVRASAGWFKIAADAPGENQALMQDIYALFMEIHHVMQAVDRMTQHNLENLKNI